MSQTKTMSFIEEGAKRVIVLFVVAPLVYWLWLEGNSCAPTDYWGRVWDSSPFVLAAMATGYLIRRMAA